MTRRAPLSCGPLNAKHSSIGILKRLIALGGWSLLCSGLSCTSNPKRSDLDASHHEQRSDLSMDGRTSDSGTTSRSDATRTDEADLNVPTDRGLSIQDGGPETLAVDVMVSNPVDSSIPSDSQMPDSGRTIDTPHQPITFDVDPATLATALSQHSDCIQYEYFGGPHFEGSGECHTQGIAHTQDGIITSCQDREEHMGFLQSYLSDPREYGSGSEQSPEWIHLLRRPFGHAVVGQGLPDTGLVVVVSSDSRDAPAHIEVRDGTEQVCTFVHSPPPRDRDQDLHLGAASLTVHEAQVHLVGCSWDCDRFYVYTLNLAEADCAPNQINELDVSREDRLREDGGAGDNNWGPYNGISVFRDIQGNMYLLASHGEWLDTWMMTEFGTAATRFRKIAKNRWGRNPAAHGGRGIFYEGMSIERLDPLTMRVWAAPHDYGRDNCGLNRVCMRAIYSCDIDL